MLISVVLSNYNGDQFLAEALDSVIEQDYQAFEFIIVDDGSTDRSAEIIRDYAARHPEMIKPILNEVNQGQAAGFNIGFEASQGELISFIDSDDIWFPDKLSKLAGFYERNKHNNNAIYQHNLLRMRNGKITASKFHWILPTGDLFAQTRSSKSVPYFTPTSGLAFPRWALEKVMPIPTEFRICADGYLTRTIFCFGDVASTSDCWGAYRIHGNNSTFENNAWDNEHYANGQLIPILNRFYIERGIDLEFSPIRFPAKKQAPTAQASAAAAGGQHGNNGHGEQTAGDYLPPQYTGSSNPLIRGCGRILRQILPLPMVTRIKEIVLGKH